MFRRGYEACLRGEGDRASADVSLTGVRALTHSECVLESILIFRLKMGLIHVAIDPGEEKIAVPWFQMCGHVGSLSFVFRKAACHLASPLRGVVAS